jgi:hypothetical protein
MKKQIPLLILTILSISLLSNSFGQEKGADNQWLKKHPVEISIGNFSVGMPFSKIFISKFYPAATAGTEFYYRKTNHSRIYQALRIGGYYSKYSTSAIFINTDIGYRFTFGFGLFADAGLGAGYSHLFRPGSIYTQNGSGEYEQVSDWGKPGFMADYTLSIGYDLTNRLNMPLSFFIRYGSYIQLFYNEDLPVLPQNSFQVGARYFFN